MGKHTYQYKRVHRPPIRALATRFLMLLVYDKLCNCHMEMLVALMAWPTHEVFCCLHQVKVAYQSLATLNTILDELVGGLIVNGPFVNNKQHSFNSRMKRLCPCNSLYIYHVKLILQLHHMVVLSQSFTRSESEHAAASPFLERAMK